MQGTAFGGTALSDAGGVNGAVATAGTVAEGTRNAEASLGDTEKPRLSLHDLDQATRSKLYKLGSRLVGDVALKLAMNALLVLTSGATANTLTAGNSDGSTSSSTGSNGFDHSSPGLSAIAAKEAKIEPLLLPESHTSVNTPADAFAASPTTGFFSFENLTGLLQRPDVNNTAKDVSMRLLSVADVMDRLGLLRALAGSAGAVAEEHNSGEGAVEEDSVNPMLRPQVARGPRAMLAALLFAWHPHEVLETESHAVPTTAATSTNEKEDAAKRKKAESDAALVESSRRLLAGLHVLQRALAGGMTAGGIPCPSALKRYEAATDPLASEEGRSAVHSLTTALSTVNPATATPPRGAAVLVPAPAEPRQVAFALLTLISFYRRWCEFCDYFFQWKAGDGARVAQSLTHTYRTVLTKLHHYNDEATKSELGKSDAGLDELREGTRKQVETMQKQVASLLGHAAASVWIKEQNSAVEAALKHQQTAGGVASSATATPPFGPRSAHSMSSEGGGSGDYHPSSGGSPLIAGVSYGSAFPAAGSPGSSSPIIRSPERAAQRTLASDGLRKHIAKMRNSPNLSPMASPKLLSAAAGATTTGAAAGAGGGSTSLGPGGVRLREDGSVAISDDESEGTVKIFLLNSPKGGAMKSPSGTPGGAGRGRSASEDDHSDDENLRLPPPVDGSPFTPRRRAAAARRGSGGHAPTSPPLSPLHQAEKGEEDQEGGAAVGGSGGGKGGTAFTMSPPPRVARTASFHNQQQDASALAGGSASSTVATGAGAAGTTTGPSPSSGFARGFLLGRSPHHRTTPAAASGLLPASVGPSPPRAAGGSSSIGHPTPPPTVPRPGAATVPSPRASESSQPGGSGAGMSGLLSRFSNPAIVHELLLDPTFGLKTPDLPDDIAIGLHPQSPSVEGLPVAGGAGRSRSGSTASRGSSVGSPGSSRSRSKRRGSLGSSYGPGANVDESKIGPVTTALLEMDRLDMAMSIKEQCLLCHPKTSSSEAGDVGDAPVAAVPQSLLPYRGGARIDPRNPTASLKRSPAFWSAMLTGAIEKERYLDSGGVVIGREAETSEATGAPTSTASGAAGLGRDRERPFADAVITCLQAGMAVLSETITVDEGPAPSSDAGEGRGERLSAQLARAVSQSLDLPLYHTLLSKGLIRDQQWVAILQHFVDLVKGLEAKARNQESDAWFAGAQELVSHVYQAHQQAAGSSTSATTDSSDGPTLSATLLQSLVLTLMPRLLAWIHFKAEQMRIDGANAHLMLLRPSLVANNKGHEYLRAQFQAAVQRGEITVESTKHWLSSAFVSGIKKAASGGSSTDTTGLQQAVGFVLTTHPHPITVAAVIEGCLQLLQESRPLIELAKASTAPSTASSAESASSTAALPTVAAATPFPSTLLFDAARLTSLQSTLQRLVLIPTLVAIVQQFIATAPAATTAAASPSGVDRCTSLLELQRRLHAWLSDEDNIRLPELEAGLVQATGDLLVAAGKQPLREEDKEDDEETPKGKLVKAVRGAVSSSHPVYSLMRGRVSQLLKARLTARFVDDAAVARVLATSAEGAATTSEEGTSDANAIVAAWLKNLFAREGELPPQVRSSILAPPKPNRPAGALTASSSSKEAEGTEAEEEEEEGPNDDALMILDVLERVVQLSLGVHEQGLYRAIIRDASLTLPS
jgi:T-complex protein 11